MATMIPPFDFARSPDSFSTACEQQSTDEWEDSSSRPSVDSSVPAPAPAMGNVELDDGWSTIAETVERRRRDSIDSQRTAVQDQDPFVTQPAESIRPEQVSSLQNKLVKRRQSVRCSKASPSTTKAKEWVSYRLDIHATSSTDYPAAEAACKQLILEAGGSVIDFVCPGGLFYRLPALAPNPLRNGAEIKSGSHITVASWTPFPAAQFSGLKLGYRHGRSNELLLLPMVRAARRQTAIEVGAVKGGMAKRCASAWLGLLARDYGRGVSYLA
ncbi:hypothetical protein LTR53_009631 [Teratosphaeriaceae sp. CCFEE 6253]|nr:hypothetical protein LTR53_009631 [Teratosphaeriaceae sp. CCFEE 6253]